MSSRLRAACLAGLFAGCAAVMFVGCSSDDSKKKAGIPVGEGGEAGEHAAGGAAATGGSAITPEGGEGGTPSEAGQGGAPVGGGAGAPEAGAPAGGESGAAGAGPLACTPMGTISTVTLPSEGSQIVCRGARAFVGFTASTGDAAFSCCGVSNTAIPYTMTLDGANGDGGGQLSFVVPDSAPLGGQNVSITCSSGDTVNSLGLSVSDTAVAPVVTGLGNSSIFDGQMLVINGSNLDQVSRVTAVSVDGSNGSSQCFIGSDGTSDSISCAFDGISAGDYYIVVEEDDCGTALNSPVLTIVPNE